MPSIILDDFSLSLWTSRTEARNTKRGSDYHQVGNYSTTLPFFSSQDNRQTDLSRTPKINWNKLRTNDKQTLWCFYPLQSIVYRLRVIDISIKETRPVMGRNCLDWLGQFFKQQVQTWELLGTGVSYQSSISRTRYNVCPYLYIYVVTRIIDQSDSTRID